MLIVAWMPIQGAADAMGDDAAHHSCGHGKQKFGKHIRFTSSRCRNEAYGNTYSIPENRKEVENAELRAQVEYLAMMTDVLSHTWKRNTGAVGITLACGYGMSTSDTGECPPTGVQIERMAEAIAAVSEGLGIPIDKAHVLTHGEAADNEV